MNSLRVSKITCRKCLLVIASIFSLLSLTTSAKEQSFERAQKELKIMSTIFQTSLADQNPKQRSFLRTKQAKATYLAKQGMVFSFNFGRNSFTGAEDWEAFGEGIGELVGSVASEVGVALGEAFAEAPQTPELAFNLERQFEAYGERLEAMELLREQNNTQREEVRELQREIREIERNKNRINSKKDEHQRLKQELEEKLNTLKDKMSAYKKSMADYRKKRDEKYTQNAKTKSDTIISTLCDYGATLRSLKNDEHITLIFENYSENKDQVYVFDFDDVRTCDSGSNLLKSAISYQL
jgi:Skp family chaperone for outer membrane proteins